MSSGFGGGAVAGGGGSFRDGPLASWVLVPGSGVGLIEGEGGLDVSGAVMSVGCRSRRVDRVCLCGIMADAGSRIFVTRLKVGFVQGRAEPGCSFPSVAFARYL